MKVYLVNLDKNPERLESSKRQLDSLGIPFQRVRAVYGRALSADERRRAYSPFRALMARGRPLNDGEIGCSLSHIEIYRDMIANSVAIALVLEDDMILKEGLPEAIAEIERFADPTRAQVIFPARQWNKLDETHVCGIVPVDSAMFTDAYVITLPAARKVLNSNYPVFNVADSWTRWHRRLGIELYRRLPCVAYQDTGRFGTDIRPDVCKKNFMKVFVWKGIRVVEKCVDWTLWKLTGR